jgi:hypothetical protein
MSVSLGVSCQWAAELESLALAEEHLDYNYTITTRRVWAIFRVNRPLQNW